MMTYGVLAGVLAGLLTAEPFPPLSRTLPQEVSAVPKSFVFPSWTANKIDVDAIVAMAAKAPTLPQPTGTIVRVSTTAELTEALAHAEPGTTILLADGVYPITKHLRIRQDRIALRSQSGNRRKVILDGSAGGPHDDMIIMRGAKDVLIADLTLRNCRHYAIKMDGDSGIHRPRIYNVKLHNVWTRGVKGTDPGYNYHDPDQQPPAEATRKIRPTGGSIRYCLFVNDTIKPYHDDGFNGDYVGGIDMMGLKDWVIADNVFIGLRGKNGKGRGAIFTWVASEGVISERNIFVNCDRSICYGNPSGPPLHMTGGIVRNNVIVNGRFAAVEMIRTRDTAVYNNSIWATDMTHDTVSFFQGSQGARFYNNLVHGWVHCPAELDRAHNVIGDLTGYFVNPEVGDLRLTSKAAAAIGRAQPLADVPEDFKAQKRSANPTIGAFESGLGR